MHMPPGWRWKLLVFDLYAKVYDLRVKLFPKWEGGTWTLWNALRLAVAAILIYAALHIRHRIAYLVLVLGIGFVLYVLWECVRMFVYEIARQTDDHDQ